MGWTEFSQREWATELGGDNAAGVCRALVLVWLKGDERSAPPKTSANMALVAEIMQSTNLANSGTAEGLRWRGLNRDPNASGPLPVTTSLADEDAVFNVMKTVRTKGKYLIGMLSGAGSGHAVGIVNAGDALAFFDPNTGHGHWPVQEYSSFVRQTAATLMELQSKYSSPAASASAAGDKTGPTLKIWEFA